MARAPETGDVVTHDGEKWRVARANRSHAQLYCYGGNDAAPRTVDVATIQSIETDADEGVSADGGRDVPLCVCGADPLLNADLKTVLAPAAGARRPHPALEEAPDAVCRVCGESLGATHGGDAVIALWRARGEQLPQRDNGDGNRGER